MSGPNRWVGVGATAAERYERELVPAMFAPWVPLLIEAAALRPGERVLDVACGTGVVTREAAAVVGPGGRVIGLDFNPAMLDVARHQPAAADAAAVEWLEASADAMPLPAASFDVVLCQQGLQQFPDRGAALREMRRVLVAGGRLVASVWSRLNGGANPGMAALVAALERHIGTEAANNRRAPFALGDPDALLRGVTEAGFREARVRTLSQTSGFATPEALVEAQLAATPLVTLGAATDEARAAVARDVRAALADFLLDGRLAAPMEVHIVTAVA